MKRYLSLALALLLVLLVLVGCQKEINDAQPPEAGSETTPKETILNGADIGDYSIVYSSTDPDYTKRAAEYIQSQIKKRTGVQLFVKSDTAAQEGREIVVGESSRDISDSLDEKTEYMQFSILADDDQIALEGDYFVIAAAAYFFVDTYIGSGSFNSSVPTEACVHEPIVKKAKNYVLLIGDGMGVYQTKLFDYYKDAGLIPEGFSDGEEQFYGYMFKNYGFSRTDSLSGTTDSAAGGTALSSGYKTINKYVGKDMNGADVMSLTELAGSRGMKTAVMSTEVSTGATPASFSAHAPNRNDTNIIKESQAQLASQYGTLIRCDYDYYKTHQLTLLENDIKSTLTALSSGDKGFFLMYEEAHIDKHCHNNDAQKAFLAVVRFNQAIGLFMEYAFYNPDTVVIITADHETGALLPDGKGGLSFGSKDHSSANVPVFAYGFGTEVFAGRTIENVQIPKTIAKAWGVANFGDKTNGFKPLN